MEKLDGTMIQATWHHGDFLVATRPHLAPALSPDIARCREFLRRIGVPDVARDCPQWTFVFECIGPDSPQVVPYERNDAVLLAARHKLHGHYMHWKQMHALGFRTPRVFFRDAPWSAVSTFLEEERDLEGVIVYAPGHTPPILKAKTSWYLRQHALYESTKQGLSRWGGALVRVRSEHTGRHAERHTERLESRAVA